MGESAARPRAANDNGPSRPRWVRLPEEAKLRGFTAEGLRRWCRARGVQIRQENHRDAWVSPAEIDAAVEAMPVANRPPAPDEIAAELDALPGSRR